MKLRRAVPAIADAIAAEAAPTVIRESFRLRALDDLAHDARKILIVISAVDAADVLVGGAVRRPGRVHGEPVRMLMVELLGGPVGVHAGQHHQAVRVRGFGQFPVQIAALQKLRLVLQRKAAGVVRHDSAGIDDDALNVRGLPILAPPRDVIADRILLGDVGLSPAIGTPEPGSLAGGRGVGVLVAERTESRGAGQVRLKELTPRSGAAVGALVIHICQIL